MKKLRIVIVFLIFYFSFFTFMFAQTGKWTAVKNLAPHSNFGVCLLMPDGTVICHNNHGGDYGTGWDRLTPDIHGSYANGTWDTIRSMRNGRLYFSTQVLPNGNVYVSGGEYGAGDTAGEVYNPNTNTWTRINGLPSGWKVYDGNSEILYNGTVLEGPQIGSKPSFDCLFYTPSTNLFSVAPTALYNHDEAAWLKLPDSSVLFVGIASPYANRYIPKLNKWIHDDTVPGMLYDPFGEEAGGAFMLPNKHAIFFGATPYNAIYSPSGDTNRGTWASADSFPTINGSQTGMPDASSAMMVNGKILCAVSPVGTANNDEFRTPAYFLEYDYTTNTFTQVTDTIPFFGADSLKGVCSYQTQMLNLPDGTILVSISQHSISGQYYIYTPGSAPIPQGKPTIDNITDIHCNSYYVTGKLFNGISEGASYGDDWQMATNYPLVRLTNGTNVYYAPTTNWNRIGAVQTDSLEDTAYFTLPSMPGGTYSVVVVANGFASNPVMLTTFGVTITSHINIAPCNSSQGSATAFASTGALPYTYLWSPSGGTNTTASNLTAGIYTVTVTEAGGCSVSASVAITQTPSLDVNIAVKEVSCIGGNNGAAAALVSGGTPTYTYLWSNGSTKTTISGLSIGTYSVIVSDSCGYTATASATITQPNPLTVIIDSTVNDLCYGGFNGKAFTKVTGGVMPYTYLWGLSAGTNATATDLIAATYAVLVTDSCGNTATARATITQPNPLVITTKVYNETPGEGCDGEAIVIPAGGTPPYTYLWLGGGQTTDTIKSHCAGNYCCVVTDSNGCSQTACVDIISGTDNLQTGNGGINIYPNPSAGIFTVTFSHPELASASQTIIEIYNVLGQSVFSETIGSVHGDNLINISKQPNGVYFYRVITEDENLLGQGKLIIQK